MSILPSHKKYNHHTKVSFELALEYQIDKVMFFSKKVNEIVEEKRNTYYISSNNFLHYLDSLINNFSSLIEYFYSYSFYSIIGTTKIEPEKLIYKYIDISNPEENIRNMKKEFNKLNIGYLDENENENENENEKFHLECRDAYIKNSNIFFSKRYHEIYVLNNYIKHNLKLQTYAPIVSFKEKTKSFCYIRIENENSYLLGNSNLLSLSEYSYDEIQSINNTEYTHQNQNQHDDFSSFFSLCGIKLINIDGIDYNKASGSVGITIDSILDTANSLCLDILNTMQQNHKDNLTLNEKLNKLKKEIKESRELMVYKNIINPDYKFRSISPNEWLVKMSNQGMN